MAGNGAAPGGPISCSCKPDTSLVTCRWSTRSGAGTGALLAALAGIILLGEHPGPARGRPGILFHRGRPDNPRHPCGREGPRRAQAGTRRARDKANASAPAQGTPWRGDSHAWAQGRPRVAPRQPPPSPAHHKAVRVSPWSLAAFIAAYTLWGQVRGEHAPRVPAPWSRDTRHCPEMALVLTPFALARTGAPYGPGMGDLPAPGSWRCRACANSPYILVLTRAELHHRGQRGRTGPRGSSVLIGVPAWPAGCSARAAWPAASAPRRRDRRPGSSCIAVG